MLAVPLIQAQIDEACRLHSQLPQWRVSDDALMRLRQSVPGFDASACLLKSVAVNSLYGTQVFAIVRMAGHICQVMSVAKEKSEGPNLVAKIAALPAKPDEQKRHFVSFAAKFCHFFVDEDLYPIYDEAARAILKMHLGKAGLVKDKQNAYRAFCKNLELLREEAKLIGSDRNLDRYLWITGMYVKWRRERGKPKQKMNVELRGLFEDEKVDVHRLLPPGIDVSQRTGEE